MNAPGILVIYPSTNENYGLWDDLKGKEGVYTRTTKPRKKHNPFVILSKKLLKKKYFRRLSAQSIQDRWFEYYDAIKMANNLSHILIIDLALGEFKTLEFLKKCKRINPNLIISLFLLNARNTSVVIAQNAFKKMDLFNWDNIFTFDKDDAEKYGYKYLGFCYYSKHPIQSFSNPQNDIYFVATLSKDRENVINETYRRLVSEGCRCDFNLRTWWLPNPRLDGINYYADSMKKYVEIIETTLNSKCILEIVRENQTGPTLRYFEAVCYNRKLLTNNPEIIYFPYYNSKYMKVFNDPKDIDINWLKEDCIVDYHYQGDFSPSVLITKIINS